MDGKQIQKMKWDQKKILKVKQNREIKNVKKIKSKRSQYRLLTMMMIGRIVLIEMFSFWNNLKLFEI